MNDRDSILSALPEREPLKNYGVSDLTRRSTIPPPPGTREPGPSDGETVRDKMPDLPSSMPAFVPLAGPVLEVFQTSFEALGGKCLDANELKKLEAKKKWVDENVGLGLQTDVESIWDAEVGFARAVCGVAETGSLMFASSQGDRLTTLVPPVSAVVLKKADIVATLSEALEIAGRYAHRNVVFVTGPSRTADIEGILVRGVHGPGELWVLLRDE